MRGQHGIPIDRALPFNVKYYHRGIAKDIEAELLFVLQMTLPTYSFAGLEKGLKTSGRAPGP